jgi:hypothetical protein
MLALFIVIVAAIVLAPIVKTVGKVAIVLLLIIIGIAWIGAQSRDKTTAPTTSTIQAAAVAPETSEAGSADPASAQPDAATRDPNRQFPKAISVEQLKNDMAAAGAASEAKDKLQVIKKTWKKDGFGTVIMWRMTFRNTGDTPIGNIVYWTTYKAETGDVVDRGGNAAILGDYTIRKVIDPGQTRTIEINDGFVNQEAFNGHFQVVSCEYIAKPLKSQASKAKPRAEG